MELEFKTEVPGITMPASMLFAYPTSAADLYSPAVEQICLPEKNFPPLDVRITVQSKQTVKPVQRSWKSKIRNLIKGRTSSRPIEFDQDELLFDARFDTDKNIAHVLENIVTHAWFARQVISQQLGKPVEIRVITNQKPSNISCQVYHTLNIPILSTDAPVSGNIVEFSVDRKSYETHPLAFNEVSSKRELYYIQPDLFNVALNEYKGDLPDKIYVPRRGNRRLINNDEVAQLLESRGFQTVYFEDLTPTEEWSIVRHAKAVVAVHGAACANLIFNRLGLDNPDQSGSGLRLIELFSPCYMLTGYRHLEVTLNGRWCAVRGQITPEVLRYLDFDPTPRNSELSPIKDPYKIDLTSLKMALEYLDL